uniref:KH domain-containing protein n=1 Tax=Bursaphelenchus xylophilus TaxID=6326 RepID=A0A1I7RRE4_BURXY
MARNGFEGVEQENARSSKLPTTPVKSSSAQPNDLDKTPRHAHGDIKSGQSLTPATAPSVSDGFSSNERPSSPTQPSSPNAEDVLAALQRCSLIAAERRRVSTDSSNLPAAQTSIRKKNSSKSAANPFCLHAGFNPTAYGFNAGLPASLNSFNPKTPVARPRQNNRNTPSTGGSSRDKPISHHQNKSSQLRSSRSQTSPGFNQKRSLQNYCRELNAEINSLDQLVRWGSIDFTPTHARRLLNQELLRVEGYLSNDDPNSLYRPNRERVGSSSVLGTIGQPPLRVPPAVLHRARRSEGRSEFELEDPITEHDEKRSVTGSAFDSDSEVTSVDADTAIEPTEGEYELVASQDFVYRPSTPVNKFRNFGQGTPAGDTQSYRSTPQSSGSGGTGSNASPKGKFSPILEAAEIPELKTQFLDHMPEDLHYLKKVGIPIAQSQCAKLFIPKVEGYNFIGRIIGPRGISVRRLESETACKILIRGRGSVKDSRKEVQLRNKDGWQHLNEKLHVLVISSDPDRQRCHDRLEEAVESVRRLLTPQYDEYKRQQLLQLAIINGTYRP